jgi:DNA segregation ATPase FtsK/SpoIIIE, S-DNA-T family
VVAPVRAARREPKVVWPESLEDTGRPDSADRPPLSLLTTPPPRDASLADEALDRLGKVLIETLRTFRVEGEIGGRTTGPVVTQYEVVPAPGVKVNRIANLDADLALALKAPSVRIVAPIPGKGAVGVEVPNPVPEVVYLREVLEAPAFRRARAQLPLALGKDLTGHPYVADLTRMPHLLIAGATGSGKSVCINTIVTSLVYRHSPRSLRLLMVDPKMVELSMYADLPHLRHPVVTDPREAGVVLKWAVLEMERRYALFSENGVRSLGEFNRRVEEGRPMRRAPWETREDGEDTYDEGPLPFIVVVVDELADLIMSLQAEIERPLTQLAQKARAIGIHLIVATQRPSVNVITGLIKANFPCRIAFRVSSKVDSRTILDQNGADALLGNGDMLFLPPGTSDPVRIQGAFIRTEDTERLMEWYRERAAAAPGLETDILEVVRTREAEEAEAVAEVVQDDRDELFRQAAELCIQFQQGSTSLLQRRLRVGYGRAARIIDQLHQAGVLGPPDGSKPREVLLGMESLDAVCGDG